MKVFIPIGSGKVTIVDLEDFLKLKHVKFRAKKTTTEDKFYAICGGGKNTKFLHRIILNLDIGDKLHVDHIDGDSLNNCKSNLRICTHQQNRCNSKISSNNSSGYKGVDFLKNRGVYRARIKYKYKEHHLGCFDSAWDAAEAYNKAARKYFGEFANLNEKKC